MNWKSIKVHLLQHSIPDREKIAEWVHGFPGCDQHELPTEATDMELLPMYAGKRCYMSFEPEANPNVQQVRRDVAAFFNNILSSGHGSVLEHSYWTFGIEGVTRVFTGEMNRHRAGVAISEGSMRFILQRIDEGIDVWLPQSLDPMIPSEFEDEDIEEKRAATRQIFADVFNSVEAAYATLAKLWGLADRPMSDRKKLTSMFRRLLPMGCCTGGVWTMNIRAMRHIVETRTSAAAEEEIAHVFRLIANQLVAAEPNLFGDFTDCDDGSWRPQYAKV